MRTKTEKGKGAGILDISRFYIIRKFKMKYNDTYFFRTKGVGTLQLLYLLYLNVFLTERHDSANHI